MCLKSIGERLDDKKFAVILAGLVMVLFVGSAFIFFFLHVETYALEDGIPIEDAPISYFGVEKSDSDIRLVNNVYVDWPDKLSDIEENYIYGTDWKQPDSDHDGMEDGWEALYARPNPITERLTIDPNINDWRENPDGDGFDLDHNGLIEGDEELFNLREYVGGVPFNSTTGRFDTDDLNFGGMDPIIDWQEIGMKGGFHLYDDPADGLIDDPSNLDNDLFDDYISYNPYLPREYGATTTNPSLWDTDLDGIDDGWESYYGDRFDSEFFEGDQTLVYDGSISILNEVHASRKKTELEVENSFEVPWVKGMISPLDPKDANYDMDVRFGSIITGGSRSKIMIFQADGLTNLEEYGYCSSPLLWDTDGDSNFNALDQEIYVLNDFLEYEVEYADSVVDWNNDGIIDHKTSPYLEDSDGDGMLDGWELQSGLDPLNSSDRFKDLDKDGLPNYLESSFPGDGVVWFQTDPLNRDTDGDGMPDGWEAYNARLISRENALNIREDLEDGRADSFKTIYTVSPIVPDADQDNDGIWITDDDGIVTYKRVPDGMTNLQEYLGTREYPVSTSPNHADTDGDGLLDGEELLTGFYGELIGDNYYTDPDLASIYHTNATLSDSDNDYGGTDENGQVGNISRRLDDWEETMGETKYTLPANGFDDDKDGMVDEREGEKLLFDPTNAINPDTDLDGWMDVDELFGIDTEDIWVNSRLGVVRTDPNKKDTDNDRMSDFDELQRIPNYREWMTDPNDPDTDRDGMEDGLENEVDFYPLVDWNKNDNFRFDPNIDNPDFLFEDIWCDIDRTDPTVYDTDHDGLPDGWEYRYGRIVKSPETKDMILWHDRVYSTNYWNDLPVGGWFWMINPLRSSDVLDDPDNDDLTNKEEYENGTDPLSWDTDGDGMPDGWELNDRYRGSYVFNPETNKHEYVLDPLDGSDWALDADHDGFVYSIWTPVDDSMTEFELVKYYFPWINLYEYQFGIDTDNDGINEITTNPSPYNLEYNLQGGKDTDGDNLTDGWEVWVTDRIFDHDAPGMFEDNDTLPRGFEELFNGSMWNSEECLIYEYKEGDDTNFDHFKTSKDIDRRKFVPYGLSSNRDRFLGTLFSDRPDTNFNGLGDGEEDLDSDDSDNYQEYLSHTDPTNSRSAPGRGNIPKPRSGPSREMMIQDVEEGDGTPVSDVGGHSRPLIEGGIDQTSDTIYLKEKPLSAAVIPEDLFGKKR